MIDKKKLILEDLKKVVLEAKRMGCKEVGAFTNIPLENVEIVIKALEQQRTDAWIPVFERLPEDDNYILVSFENFGIPDIARYKEEEDGSGAFYPRDDDKSYVSYGIFVNAWMPLPEPYKEAAR